MRLPLFYLVILLMNVFESSSEMLYNKGGMKRYFTCSSEGVPHKNEIFKLYLSLTNLIVHCFFQTEDEVTSKGILSVFTAGGLAPSLEIINSTYSGVFHFNLTLFIDQIFWLIDIPRENITKNTDITAVEEWLVRISLHHGLNIYNTEGTLLDIAREPILQWHLGIRMSKSDILKLHLHVKELIVTKCPCANDVALLGFILKETYDGIYVGLTFSGFWDYSNTTWYNMTETFYAELEKDITGLSVVDMVLTNHFFIMLTSLGLYVSQDLRYPSNSALKADYIKGKLWYSERCFANRESFEADFITITFDRNKTLSEASTCFYSKEPFLDWLPCIPQPSRAKRSIPSRVITFLVDIERENGVYLLSNQKETFASVNILRNNQPSLRNKFPKFVFPPSFSVPVGMVFHPRSNFLYAYGNQVWISMDGGNTFEFIADFHDDVIKKSYHSFYTSDITFVTQSGKVYLTKAGFKKYSKIGTITDTVFTLYYDHLGFIHKLTPDHFEAGDSQSALGNSKAIFQKNPDMSFKTALAPQFIFFNEIVFFAHVPPDEPPETVYTKEFSNIHLGKMIHSRKSGSAYIEKVLHHRNQEGFFSSVIAKIVDPFAAEEMNESPCLFNSLFITENGNAKHRLTLMSPSINSSFQQSDLQKTVVIPGYSSILITDILNNMNALGIATMPVRAPNNVSFPKDAWFLYNFGLSSGQTWSIFSKSCHYWLQQSEDDSLAPNMLRYIDLGRYKSLNIKVMPTERSLQISDVPLVKILVGNPRSLYITAEGYFDNTLNYVLNVTLSTKFLHQGLSSLAFIMWDASTDCFVTTFVPIMKSSCSYLGAMYHIPREHIPVEHWSSGIHRDPQGFNMIKTLPVNYRPPSTMGIAIPLSDNFYHADPSKPVPRNLFFKSMSTGRFKQCANVSTRAQCNCTQNQKMSHAVAFSDCREKVPRFKFPVKQYPVSLEISSRDGPIPVNLPYLVTVTEVNGRDNWDLSKVCSLLLYLLSDVAIVSTSTSQSTSAFDEQHTPESIEKLKLYLTDRLKVPVYNPEGLNLTIKGSELFHFKVSVVPGVTFCNLVEEFQIYVDEVPLPFPGHSLIAIAAAITLGGFIFIVFMFQLHNIHPWQLCQNILRRNQVNVSDIPVIQHPSR